MAQIRRVDSVSTGYAGAPYYTALYFRNVESVTADQLIQMVRTFWQDAVGVRTNALVTNILGDVPLIDTVSGQAVGLTTGQPTSSQGTVNTGAEWPAKQGLLRLRTGDYASGRQIQGRVFLPAVATAAGEQQPTSTYRAAWNTAAATMIASSSSLGPWVVWSRKGGEAYTVESANVWSEWAILKSRRPNTVS